MTDPFENMVKVIVAEALYIEGASTELIKRLRAACTHVNPDYGLMRAMGRWTGATPTKIRTWSDLDGGGLRLPRGAMGRLRSIAASAGEKLQVQDARVSEPVRWPSFNPNPGGPNATRPYQAEAKAACIRREQGILRAPTGCLAGDTVIGINRGGKSFQIPLERLVRMQNGGTTTRVQRADGSTVEMAWDLQIPTTVRTRGDDGYIALRPLRAAYFSGPKQLYVLVTESGHRIRATADHQFLTPDGWKRLGDLEVSDEVYVEGQRGQSERVPKPWYRLVSGLVGHPFAGRLGVAPGKGGVSVPKHRLVIEAAVNDIDFDRYVELLRNPPSTLREQIMFLDPEKWAVHHIDHDHLNNELVNLALMTHDAHQRSHSSKNTKNVQIPVVASSITSIEVGPVEETYDLALDYPHNFLADGIVVHNSGKTHVALDVFSTIGQRALVIVRDRKLLDQWVAKAKHHLGMRPGDYGIVRGGQKHSIGNCLTLALQQTLWAKGFPLQDFARQFGAVAVDEVHGAAAQTVSTTVGAFPARYRFGFSADETRKDRKEFLVYDLFGEVLYEVTRAQVEADGFTVPVVVRLVPTEFAADWFSDAPVEERDFKRLVDEIITNPRRDHSIRTVLKELCTERLVPALVFTHRREHAARLVEDVAASLRVGCGLMMGGKESSTNFDETLEALRRGTMPIAVGTFQSIGQGIDIPAVLAGVIATPLGSSNRQYFNQVRGRICRPAAGKTVGYLYYLWDRDVFPRIPEKLLEWNDGRVEIFDDHVSEWVPSDERGESAA